MATLTLKQKEILTFLSDFIRENGVSPTFREIADHFGYASMATVHEHLESIERKGFIRKGGFCEARSIEIVGEEYPMALTIKSLEGQRDDLLAALKEITHCGKHPLGWMAAEGIARAAISKAEEPTP